MVFSDDSSLQLATIEIHLVNTFSVANSKNFLLHLKLVSKIYRAFVECTKYLNEFSQKMY